VPGVDVTVKEGIELPAVGVMFPEHLSGPGFGQSVVMLLLSRSKRRRWVEASPSMRVKEMVSPWVTVIVGFDPENWEEFHPTKYA
jgi:hypothetical protein